MLHVLRRTQLIKSDIDTVWNFISTPLNLARITPPEMRFEIIEPAQLTAMYAGQLIEYYVRPLFGMKVHWVTEIVHVEKGKYFVDEQRVGPYALWHHKHFIREVDGAIEMVDIIHYRLPFGILGKLVNSLIVKRKLDAIFDFRQRVFQSQFQ